MGEALITNNFDTKLKNRTQWNRWCVGIKALLNNIIGARGALLSYIIRDPAAIIPSTFTSREERTILSASHISVEFDYDKRAVHNILISNIVDDSDTYIYLKPSIKSENGAVYIPLLRDRYENVATMQERVDDSNGALYSLIYKDERA